MTELIRKFIQEKREEKNIINQVIRDDVFEILEKECTVLYYCLDDEIDGFHMSKPVSGVQKQFVFINTNKVLQEQVWTAGHELGHVWKVDQFVKNNIANEDVDIEKIVGKFTAEFLMPKDIFVGEIRKKLMEYQYEGSVMSLEMMIELVTYLMNFFAVPSKAVIIRFQETGFIKEENVDAFLEGFKSGRELYNKIITENQYTRLESRKEVYSMGTIEEDIALLENLQIVKSKYADKVREAFHIESNPQLFEKLEFRG